MYEASNIDGVARLMPFVGAQDRSRTCTPLDTRTWNVRVYQFRHLGSISLWLWAENETRTRDPNLGKVVLYQLSYFRNLLLLTNKQECEEEETRTPTPRGTTTSK